MERVHIAVAVTDIDASIAAYSSMLGRDPDIVVAGEYALWRTGTLNLSIRRSGEEAGTVRHVGFERDDAPAFETFADPDGLVWESFSRAQQEDEIRATWPDAGA